MKKHIKIALLLVAVSFSFLMNIGVVSAEEPLDSLTAGVLYEKFVNYLLSDIKSLSFVTETLTTAYKGNLQVFESYTGVAGTGVDNPNTSFIDGNVSASTYQQTQTDGEEYVIDLITKEGDIYAKFPLASNKEVKKTWFKIPYEKYELLGQKLGIAPLFDLALVETKEGTEEELFLRKVVQLARKHKIYAHVGGNIDDGIKIPRTVRFDLIFDPAGLTNFYKEIDTTFTAEEKAKTVLSVAGFREMINNPRQMQQIADNSYVSLFFDKKTQKPVHMIEALVIPTFSGLTDKIVFIKDGHWVESTKKASVKTPKKFKTLEEFLRLNNVVLEGVTSSVSSELDYLLDDYQNSRNKIERADNAYYVAMEYDNQGNRSKAAEYYRISASNYKKGSVDHYEALAQAEWSMRNGSKAKENFELALKKGPNDNLVLNQYGYFLLGISVASANVQDLNKALVLNQKLVEKYPDDSGLLNLYINYIMLNDISSANALKTRFSQFETGENYNFIARAYHRMGNQAQATAYSKLAKDLGYVQTGGDKDFFAMIFR